MTSARADARVRFAELSSSVGAGVLGLGLGALLAASLRGLGIAILVVGLLLHAWGMSDKHRLERAAGAVRPAWSTALYWICWLALGALAGVIVMRAI